MNRQAKFEKFLHRVMEISPEYVTILGKGIPGMLGASAGATGGFTPATLVTRDLQMAALAFARQYIAAEPDKKAVRKASDRLEGELLGEQTLGTLNARQTEALITELHALVEEEV